MPKPKTHKINPIVAALNNERKAARLSQGELAKRCRVSAPSVCRFFNGHHSPLLDSVETIAKGIGVEIKFELVPIKEVNHEN